MGTDERSSERQRRGKSGDSKSLLNSSTSETSSEINDAVTTQKWPESVLQKWRGALVKARSVLQEKRQKKREQHTKATLARLKRSTEALVNEASKEVQNSSQNASHKSSRKRKTPIRSVLSDHIQGGFGIIPTAGSLSKSSAAEGHEDKGQATREQKKRKYPKQSSVNTKPSEMGDRKQLERTEETRNKWGSALEVAGLARYSNRERRTETGKNVSNARLKASKKNKSARDIPLQKRKSISEIAPASKVIVRD